MADTLVFPGKVEWSGENPGISLKETPDGPFVALASFFRVVLSPHGRGHALVLFRSPHEATPPADRSNLCLTDNEPLARWLIAEFLSHFGLDAVADLPGLEELKGSGMFDGRLPAGFSVPLPSDDPALREDEDPLEPGDLDYGLAPPSERASGD